MAPAANPAGNPPTMEMKNVVKNDGGVVKQHAIQNYEETFSLAVRHGKMTENRK